MTAKPPPIPAEQRALHDDGQRPEAPLDGKVAETNLKEQGDAGNLHQNVETVHARTQAR